MPIEFIQPRKHLSVIVFRRLLMPLKDSWIEFVELENFSLREWIFLTRGKNLINGKSLRTFQRARVGRRNSFALKVDDRSSAADTLRVHTVP